MLHKVFFKSEKVGKFYFSSNFFVMVRHISTLIYSSQKIALRTLLLEEVVFVEMINVKLNIEVNILRKQHEFLYNKKDFICYRS